MDQIGPKLTKWTKQDRNRTNRIEVEWTKLEGKGPNGTKMTEWTKLDQIRPKWIELN